MEVLLLLPWFSVLAHPDDSFQYAEYWHVKLTFDSIEEIKLNQLLQAVD